MTAIGFECVKYLPDINKPFILTTDASNIAYGGCLSQLDDNGIERPCSFYSKKLNDTQKNYSATDKELLGMVECIQHFKKFLLGNKFTLRTDHMALKYMKTGKLKSSRLMRYSLESQDYDFDIQHVAGEKNMADFLR